MSKTEVYIAELKKCPDWLPFLAEHSWLPSPRANLELAYAAARLADRTKANELIASDQPGLGNQSPLTFVVLCGVMSLGKFASGDPTIRSVLRSFASDQRWRVREGVAMALQLWGEQDMPGLLSELSGWVEGNPYEQRAVVAAVSEPVLLRRAEDAKAALVLLDEITQRYIRYPNPKDDAYRVLTLGLSYGWSVVVAALPDTSKLLMEKWIAHPNTGIHRVMRENLTKKRLEKMDAAWVEKMKAVYY